MYLSYAYLGARPANPARAISFRYLWSGNQLKPELRVFKKIILANDGESPGRIVHDVLAVRLGSTRCWYVTIRPESRTPKRFGRATG